MSCHDDSDDLHELCQSGAVARAIDLAIQHVAEFGPDDAVLALLAGALETPAQLLNSWAGGV